MLHIHYYVSRDRITGITEITELKVNVRLHLSDKQVILGGID